jgi:hypothetical protein
MTANLRALLPAAIILLTSKFAVAAAQQPWPILEALPQAQCAWIALAASAQIFDNAAQWESAFPAGQKPGFSRQPDWKKELVVGLTLGERPSSGYGISLQGNAFVRKHGSLHLGFREDAPSTDAFQQQVMTRPCIFMLTRRGNWRRAVLRNSESGAELEAQGATPFVKAHGKAHQ